MTRDPRAIPRFLSRVDLVATAIGVLGIVYGAVTGEWWWLGASALAVVAIIAPGPLKLVALVAAVAVGAWLAAVCAALSVLAWLGGLLAPRLARAAAFDESGLVDAVERLPHDLRAALERSVTGPVDSVALLRAALLDDRSRWSLVQEVPDREGSEGGCVGSTRWTVVAAEAALMAGCRPDSSSPLDVHHLAGAALLLPFSAASVAVGGQRQSHPAATQTLGLSLGQAVEQMMRAARHPGGELIAVRVEKVSVHGPELTAELPEAVWRQLRVRGKPARSDGSGMRGGRSE